MIFVTGDTHGHYRAWEREFPMFLKEGDTVIVLGDFGFNFWPSRWHTGEGFFDYLAEQPYTVLFLDGNHENFPWLNALAVSEWNGGRAQFVRQNVIHLMRGEVYTVDGESVFVMGGGYSLDRERRVPGLTWWPEEMPSDEEYRRANANLAACGYRVDYILTHTASERTIAYISSLGLGVKRGAEEEKPLTNYLQWVEETVAFRKWYFGHFHLDREMENKYAMLNDVRELRSGKLVMTRNPSAYD